MISMSARSILSTVPVYITPKKAGSLSGSVSSQLLFQYMGGSYTDMVRNNLLQIHSIATETALKMAELLRRNKLSESDARESYTLEKQLNDLRTLLKAQNMENVRTQKYDYPESVSYMDLVGYYEQLGDYVLNVVQAATKG